MGRTLADVKDELAEVEHAIQIAGGRTGEAARTEELEEERMWLLNEWYEMERSGIVDGS